MHVNVDIAAQKERHAEGEDATKKYKSMVDDMEINWFYAIFLSVCAGLGEEVFFRGVLQQILAKWTRNNWVSILLTAFIFSAIHFQFLTFLPRFFMGIMLKTFLHFQK